MTKQLIVRLCKTFSMISSDKCTTKSAKRAIVTQNATGNIVKDEPFTPLFLKQLRPSFINFIKYIKDKT